MTAVLNLRDSSVVNFYRPPVGDEQTLEMFAKLRTRIDESLQYWARKDVVRRSDSGCLAVLAKVVRGEGALDKLRQLLNDPSKLFDFAYLNTGDTDDRDEAVRYAANALRKELPTVREGMDSLVLKYEVGEDVFVNPIQKGDDTLKVLEYRDFPHGGAVLRDNGKKGDEKITILAAISGFHEKEDHDEVDGLAQYALRWFELDAEKQNAKPKHGFTLIEP